MLQLSALWFFCLQFNSTCSNTSGCIPVHSSNPSMWSPMLFGPSECYFSASIGEFCIFEPFLHILMLIGMFAVIFVSLAMLCVRSMCLCSSHSHWSCLCCLVACKSHSLPVASFNIFPTQPFLPSTCFARHVTRPHLSPNSLISLSCYHHVYISCNIINIVASVCDCQAFYSITICTYQPLYKTVIMY